MLKLRTLQRLPVYTYVCLAFKSLNCRIYNSSDSGKRQALCHQQMGCCYAENIPVGRIPSLSIWMPVYPQVYLALSKRMLLTAVNSFFWTCVCSCFHPSHARGAGFYLLCARLFHLISPCSFFPCCATSPDKLDVKEQACPWPCSHTISCWVKWWESCRWKPSIPALMFWCV